MLVGYTPFNADSQGAICKGIVRKKLGVPRDVTDPGARSVIRKILEKDPVKRFGCGAKGPVEIMHHEWFKNFNWDDLEKRKMKAPELGIPKLKKGEGKRDLHKECG